MHFTYEEKLRTTELCQGDVLARTPEIDALLESVHPHFHKKESNLFFMVLTQSCDLVQRGNGGECKATYITIAPVRPLENVLQRQIASLQSPDIKADLPVLTDKAKSKLSDFLTRLFNNNESGYFFLDAADTELPGDCCAFLNLSIAIKSSEHYQKCLSAKKLQLTETFQAKLGWLVGQMYSRVGTMDWDTPQLKTKVQASLENAAIWIPDSSVKKLREILFAQREGQATEAEPNQISESEIQLALKKIPSRKSQILEQVSSVVSKVLQDTQQNAVPDPEALAKRVIRRLEGDMAFTTLTK